MSELFTCLYGSFEELCGAAEWIEEPEPAPEPEPETSDPFFWLKDLEL